MKCCTLCHAKCQLLTASRQGKTGSRSCRAVIITFATEDERVLILRCKARLSRKEETQNFGINEVLSPEQQQHVHRVWELCHQARQNGMRASIRGYNLFIDGQWVDPEQIAAHWTAQGQQHQAGLALNPPPLLHSLSPQQHQHTTSLTPLLHCLRPCSQPSSTSNRTARDLTLTNTAIMASATCPKYYNPRHSKHLHGTQPPTPLTEWRRKAGA